MKIKLSSSSDEGRAWLVTFEESEYQAVNRWFRQLRAREKWFECPYGDWRSQNLWGLLGHHQARWRVRREYSAHSYWSDWGKLEVLIVIRY